MPKWRFVRRAQPVRVAELEETRPAAPKPMTQVRTLYVWPDGSISHGDWRPLRAVQAEPPGDGSGPA